MLEEERLARDVTTSPQMLTQLATHEKWDVRYRVAQNPNTPIATKDMLFSMGDFAGSFAMGIHTPAHILEQLATHPAWTIRNLVARNDNCSPHALDTLAHDENGEVRTMVAFNRNVSMDTLLLLSQDEVEKVRVYAQHKIAVIETKGKLCFHFIGICRKPHKLPYTNNAKRICPRSPEETEKVPDTVAEILNGMSRG